MRCALVDLLFSLVWVPGKRLISLLGLDLKGLGTTDVGGSEGPYWYGMCTVACSLKVPKADPFIPKCTDRFIFI